MATAAVCFGRRPVRSPLARLPDGPTKASPTRLPGLRGLPLRNLLVGGLPDLLDGALPNPLLRRALEDLLATKPLGLDLIHEFRKRGLLHLDCQDSRTRNNS
eukprot:8049192-Alexandrium_andersonii.AAC.1